MFKCALTGQISAPHEKPITVVAAKRFVSYNGGSSHGWEAIKELKLTKQGHEIFLQTQVDNQSVFEEKLQTLKNPVLSSFNPDKTVSTAEKVARGKKKEKSKDSDSEYQF